MAESGQKDVEGLQEITESPICMSAFTDIGMLPCVHTFCFECLKRTSEARQKKPGDEMPCPLCCKEFVIPADGVNGMPKNVFTEDFTVAMQKGKSCTEHIDKPLNHYCAECKKTVCVICSLESHTFYDCKEVTTVDKEFRKIIIENKTLKISTYLNEMLLIRSNNKKRKADFFKEIDETEKEIHKRNQKLKDMIDQHTRSLLVELSAIKSKHLKEMENQMEEFERHCTVFRSYEAYCRELALKGSASDICSSFDELIVRADKLEREHETFVRRPYQCIKVSFQSTDLEDNPPNTYINFLGAVEAKTEITSHYEDFTFAVGLDDFTTITKDVVKLNLHQPYEISIQGEIPTTMQREAVAAVYDNTMYVAGIGHNADEIWKYNQISGWKQCASLVQGRRRHSAAFIDEVLYICGGFVDSTELVLDSVEAFNAVTNKCTAVGKLIYAVKSSGNCVPFRRSLYIFGGSDEDDRVVSHVQVYSTKENTCTLISKPMPRPYYLMRAVLWGTSVILLGQLTCFVFHIESESWEEREQFKTNIAQFGLVLENERIFVIGGGRWKNDANGFGKYNCREHIRYVPLMNIIDDKPPVWKIHGKLPKPSLVYAYATMRCNVSPTPGYEGGLWMREKSAIFEAGFTV